MYIHLEVIKITGDYFDDHDHIYIVNKVIEIPDSTEFENIVSVNGDISIELYKSNKDGILI